MLEFQLNGGSREEFRLALGMADWQWDEYFARLEKAMEPRRPTADTPILIPETSPTRYISFQRAVNLRFPADPSGDWHRSDAFFGYEEPYWAPLAGDGQEVGTNPTLGSLGVRDMGKLIADYEIKPYDGPV